MYMLGQFRAMFKISVGHRGLYLYIFLLPFSPLEALVRAHGEVLSFNTNWSKSY